MKTLLFTTLALIFLTYFSAPSVFAQTESPCGIVYGPVPTKYRDYYPEIVAQPITDCDDPFTLTTEYPNPYTLKINQTIVPDGGTITVPEGKTRDYKVTGDSILTGFIPILYKHDGQDLRYVEIQPPEFTDADLETYVDSYFATQAERDFYRRIVLSNNKDQYFYDENGEQLIDEQGSSIIGRYYDFEYVSTRKHYEIFPEIAAGTYTMLLVEYLLTVNQLPWYKKFANLIIPTAHAITPQTDYPEYRFAIDFTITKEEEEPQGASSVLFLPGIQASKLYKDGLLGIEDQIWTPDAIFNNDIYNLSMSTNGVSDNNVYTRDILDAIPNAGSVYSDFIDFMNQLDSENKIESWKPFAYDWRYSVKNVANNGTLYENGIRDAVAEIESLADNSFTDKVIIIGHSNGGLLAKAIMERLESDSKSGLIDKVILLASPQLGTPKAIGTILHGYDQTDALGGIIMDGQIVRKVLNNMPGAYGLLPTEKYFNSLSESLIVFNDNNSTQAYRNIYGSSISNYGDMVRYIKGEDGLDRGLENPISKPARANVNLLNTALTEHNNLDNWIAPAGVEVIEIVGTGLPTMKAVEYREITETKCASAGPAGPVCVVENEIKPYARLTHYGDGTVVQRSAEGYEGEKRKYFINLTEIKRNSPATNFKHHNITEAPPVMELLSDLIISTTTENNEFISTNSTAFNDSYDVEVIDSPVRLLATDSQGNQTGVVVVNGVRTIKEEIPGSQYFEFGDTKYFVVPKGTNRTTKLFGEANGGYTLTTVSFGVNDAQTVNTVLKNATTTPTMVAEYKNTGSQYSNITTDINGDGTIDVTTSMSGVPVVVVSYPLLIAKIQSLSLLRIYKQALLLIINSAQVYANKTTQVTLNKKIERGLLVTTEELIKLYIKKRYLTQVDGQALLQMITILKNK